MKPAPTVTPRLGRHYGHKDLSLNGALVGGMAGWVAEVAIQEVTGHHVTTGILEILGAAAGMWRLDRRLTGALRDTLAQAQEDRPRLPGDEAPHRRTDPGPAGVAGDPGEHGGRGHLGSAGLRCWAWGYWVRLGRQVLAGPVADSGVLPCSYYRHLALEALEAEDFPGALRYLKRAVEPLLAQIMVFRLRLLSARHRRQSAAIQDLRPRSRALSAGSTTRPC